MSDENINSEQRVNPIMRRLCPSSSNSEDWSNHKRRGGEGEEGRLRQQGLLGPFG